MPDRMAKKGKGRPGPDEGEDAFVEGVTRLVVWVQEHQRGVIVTAVIAVLLVAAGFWYRSYQQNLRDRAATRLQEVRSQLSAGDQEGLQSLRSFVSRFEGTRSGLEARVMLARIELGEGRPERALELVRPVLEARPVDTPTGYAAASLRAGALGATGRTEEALDAYRALAENARFAFQRRQAADDYASLLVEAGRLAPAESVYAELVEETEAEGAETYAVRLGEVRAMMASGGTDADSAAASAAGDSAAAGAGP